MKKNTRKVRIDDLRDLRHLAAWLYWSDANSTQNTNHKIGQLLDGLNSMIAGELVKVCAECKKEQPHD